jgi:hypothetical protein
MSFEFTDEQQALIDAPLDQHIFVEGPAGAGKSSAAVARLGRMLREGIPASEILILVPQRTLGQAYLDLARHPEAVAGGELELTTLAGLSRRMVDLYWPLVSGEAGFEDPNRKPTFLNIETAQFHMALVVAPLLDQGYFEGVAIDRNRLYGQILDNLNKAAFVGFDHTELAARLNLAWIDQSHQRRLYLDAQDCASRFREHCLRYSLLDFSLMVELFRDRLWPNSLCRDQLLTRYKHIIAENIEEDTPVSHDILTDWVQSSDSAMLIYDWDAGFRQFLGADPRSAYTLREQTNAQHIFPDSLNPSPHIEALRRSISLSFEREAPEPEVEIGPALQFEQHRYMPEMLDWITEQIQHLVMEEGQSPGEIVVLAPFLSDALRFSIMNRLEQANIPVQSHRPSRSLREEPATQALTTFAALAHPDWNLRPVRFDISYALRQAVQDLDLVRAQLLAEILFRSIEGRADLLEFGDVKPDMQERISFVLGGRYDTLRMWTANYRGRSEQHFDHFLAKLFGELLSQPGFGFHHDLDAGRVTANLIDSAREFRRTVGPQIEAAGGSPAATYLETVRNGLLAAQNVRSWNEQQDNAVLVAPAYTFLMANRAVDTQFWINVNSTGWAERLYQPITHPHVLSRHWPPTQRWTDEDEIQSNADSMHRLLNGLLLRCRERVYLGLSDLDEHGFEQSGPLLAAIQYALRVGEAD